MREILEKKYKFLRLAGGFGSLYRRDGRAMSLCLLAFFLLPVAAFDSILIGLGVPPFEATALSWPDIQYPVQSYSSGISLLALGILGLIGILKSILWCFAAAEIATIVASRLDLGKYRPFAAVRAHGKKLLAAGALFGLFQFLIVFLKQQIPLANQKDVIVFFIVFESIGVLSLAFASAFIASGGAPVLGGIRSGFGLVVDELMKNLIIFVVFLMVRVFLNLVFQMILTVLPAEWGIIAFQLLVALLYFPYISFFVILYFKQTRFNDDKAAQV